MIYIVASDVKYYNDNIYNQIKQKYNLECLVVMPKNLEDEIKKNIGKKTGFLHIVEPPENLNKFLVVETMANHKDDIRTSQEIEYGITTEEALMKKLGLLITKSEYNFSDLGGAKKLRQWVKRVTIMKQRGIPIKPIFFLGLAGVGKSFFVECYAGETNSFLVELNLTLILESDKPIKMINDIFEYLTKSKMRVTVRIDEIEQAIRSRAIMGELLTLFNDLNMKGKYQINGELFATANNITDIIKEFPQFFRHGRFNEKFFANYPKREDALDMFRVHFKDLKLEFEDSFVEYIYTKIDIIHNSHKLEADKCVYVPAEIRAFAERLCMFTEFTDEVIEECAYYIKPQLKTAQEGTAKMLSEAKKIGFEEV